MDVWICEKASQARDIARVLGGRGGSDGSIETPRGVVTWAVGHLLEQVGPEGYDPALKQWSFGTLPIVPATWKLEAVSNRASQLRTIGGLLKRAKRVILATDADREGETIGRELLEHFGFKGAVQRLWLSALDDESIKKALASLRDGRETEPLHWAAQARSRADWLVGMNLSRAATLAARVGGGSDGVRSVGRVQTPTLALVVRRDREIENFKPRDYYELVATVRAQTGTEVRLRYAPPAHPEDRRVYDRAVAEAGAARARGAEGPIQVETRKRAEGPPPLFSLSSLQQACNRRFGYSADKTLQIAQALYETHKLATYPRTDCNFLPNEQESDVGRILKALGSVPDLRDHAAGAAGAPVVRKSTFNTEKVTAHHAIVPTGVTPDLQSLSSEERNVFLLIARQYLAALMPDFRFDETRIRFDANGVPFTAVGRVPTQPGWKALFGGHDADEDEDEGRRPLPGIPNGTPGTALAVEVEGKRTQPPKPYTEGTLIEDMKAIAKFATDPAIRERLKETKGIGTEATRASIIKSLRDRRFLAAKGKAIISTAEGRALVDALPPAVTDAALTALWEDQLEAIASGKLPAAARDEFVGNVANQVGRLVEQLKARARAGAGEGGAPRRESAPTEKMLAYAQAIAQNAGLKRLPESVSKSFEACKAFIDKHSKSLDRARSEGRPTPQQVEYAKRLAGRAGVPLPEDVHGSRAACSKFIDQYRVA